MACPDHDDSEKKDLHDISQVDPLELNVGLMLPQVASDLGHVLEIQLLKVDLIQNLRSIEYLEHALELQALELVSLKDGVANVLNAYQGVGVFFIVVEELGVQAHFLVETVCHIENKSVSVSHDIVLL